MIVGYFGTKYRLAPDGRIEFYSPEHDEWRGSAHDGVLEERIAEYASHPLLPLLRKKFNRNKATTENPHS